MASQIPASNCECCEVPSFVRGYHAYQDVWNPSVGQVLMLRRQPDNLHDRHAVAVVTSDSTVVGHVPYNPAPIFSHFLAREFNKGTVCITGERTNRGAGYGLEVPCIYRLYGPKGFVDRLSQKVGSLRDTGLLPRSTD